MKKYLPDLIAILAFAVISFVYFYTPTTENLILFQHDTSAGAGANQELKEYYERTGERTRWTNSIFGGMPTYQMSPSYDSTDTLRIVEKAYHLFLPNYVWLAFVMMLGFYILLRVFGMKPALSAVGAIAWGFSSYFFILIQAGHLWKFITLAYIPPTIAGIVLAYRGKYLAGGLLAALFAALQILSNHVQMTYYFLFVILAFVIVFFIQLRKEDNLARFWKASGVLIIAAIVAVAINIPNLYHTYQYSKYTMRAQSELVQQGNKASQTSSGLNRDYITQWSYGLGETFTLLIPNVKGGASTRGDSFVPLSSNETAMKKANPMYMEIYSQLPQYWGQQPGTSGPVYVGALILMLFVLGCFIVKGPMKWGLLVLTILSIMLAWGHNFMAFTNFFIDWIPMYNKFRAVTSILVIAEFTIPLLAILALAKLIQQPERINKGYRRPLLISFALTGGIALLFALFPRVFFSEFVPPMEMSMLQRGIPAEYLGGLIDNLQTMRVAIFTADAWRSFFVVLLGAVLIFIAGYKKMKPLYLVLGIGIITLVDLWQVDKRYLSDNLFKPATEATFAKTPIDDAILKDTDPYYRVLNMATNTFGENQTSYWHKNVAGYSAVKMQRYQEMIEHYIAPEMNIASQMIKTTNGDMQQVNPEGFQILNMLNTKYFIARVGETVQAVRNPYAFGNAWFVDNILYVDNANQEIETIGEVDLKQAAVVDSRFENILPSSGFAAPSPDAKIELISYEPNHLVYKSTNQADGVAVFSEVYYPHWKVTIDGKPVEYGRADYVLRVLSVPAGEHTIEMTFDPQSVHLTEAIAYGGLILLLLGAIGCIVYYWRRNK